MNSRCRLLIVSNIPTPNNDALFAQLARLPDLELMIAYCAEKEPNRAWDLGGEKAYPVKFLPELISGAKTRFNPGVFSLLRKFKPDVVVLTGGYVYPTGQLLAWWLSLFRYRWYYWAEELTFPAEGLLRRLGRALLRRPLRFANGILAIGKRSVESFRRIGVPDNRIHLFRYYADTAQFEAARHQRDTHRSTVRRKHGLDENGTVVLVVGQLIPRKGVDVLLRAFAAAKVGDRPLQLLIVGEGPLNAEIRTLATDLGVADRVKFAGFIEPAGLPPFMAAADAIVVPSRKEGWGLVVSEAMAAGLPVIASDRVNAAVDLITPDQSGFIFPVDDVPALTAILDRVHASPSLRASVSARAIEIAAGERSAVAAARLARLVCPQSSF